MSNKIICNLKQNCVQNVRLIWLSGGISDSGSIEFWFKPRQENFSHSLLALGKLLTTNVYPFNQQMNGYLPKDSIYSVVSGIIML